jgi:hypothetical protein
MDKMQRELCDSSKYYFNLRQECLYEDSNFLYFKWYRKLYGGEWRLLKLGEDTPYIKLFSIWTKVTTNDDGDDCWSGYYEVLEREVYSETGVLTRWEVFKQFFKNIFRRNR